MLKKQTSKILVFLLMLGILYGCKRQILDPLNPQTNLPSKVQLDKVKGFYENGRYKNQPKRSSSNGNERMTTADSARFKDFEPQWDKTEVELLPNNEKMLIVPVVRFLSVSYNPNYAFVRKLCIRLDVNEDLIEANIVEIIGKPAFVAQNYKVIFANYKNTSVISGFYGIIVINEIDYDVMKKKGYVNGTFTQEVNGEYSVIAKDVSPDSPCGIYIVSGGDENSGGLAYNSCDGTIIVGDAPIVGGGGGGGGGGTYTPNGPQGNTPWTSGNNGSNEPGHGGGSTGNPYIPYDYGCTICDTEEGYIPDLPMTPADSLKLVKYRKIVSRTHSRDAAKELKFAKMLDSLRNASPIVDSVYRKIEQNLATRTILTPGGNLTAKIEIQHIVAAQGPKWAENFGITKVEANGIPTIKLGEKAGPEVFTEELTHALQYLERNTNVAATNDELVHMEFEAKVINHMIFGVDGGTELFRRSKNKLYRYDDSYIEWIANIKLENLSNFGAGAFCWTNFEMHIENFATFPDPAYNTLQNPNFVPTRLPTILFLLFR